MHMHCYVPSLNTQMTEDSHKNVIAKLNITVIK